MDIRSSLEGLKSLLGTPAPAPATTQQPKSGWTAAEARWQRSSDIQQRGERGLSDGRRRGSVRMDKVAEHSGGAGGGNYNVPHRRWPRRLWIRCWAASSEVCLDLAWMRD
jgi:hypothetical protein